MEHLDPKHHVSRYCGGSHIEDGHVDGAAFMLRPGKDLSVNWLEYFGRPSRADNVDEVRQVFISKDFTLGATALFAVLKVDTVLRHVEGALGRSLTAVHQPEEDDPSHASLQGYTHEDDMIADLIAEVILETYPAKESL